MRQRAETERESGREARRTQARNGTQASGNRNIGGKPGGKRDRTPRTAAEDVQTGGETSVRKRWKARPVRQIKNVQLSGTKGGKRAFICYNVTDARK